VRVNSSALRASRPYLPSAWPTACCTEADDGADWVGLSLQNGAIEIAREKIAPACGPSGRSARPKVGAICFAEGRSSPVIGVAGGAGNSTLPGHIEAAGQRIEQRHGTRVWVTCACCSWPLQA